jgi:hypothetical protein
LPVSSVAMTAVKPACVKKGAIATNKYPPTVKNVFHNIWLHSVRSSDCVLPDELVYKQQVDYPETGVETPKYPILIAPDIH